IWDLYEDFEKSVHEDDANVMRYDSTCHVSLDLGSTNYKKYKDFCMKLMRNLGAYSSGQELCRPKTERCKTLRNWLYNVIIDQNVPTDIISTIFKESKEIIGENCNMFMCDFSYNEKIKEPKKIIKLLNLIDNVNIFYDIMIDITKSDYCSCEKYINECVNIYKDMKNKYCTKGNDKDINRETCSYLDTFDTTYTNYLYKKLKLPAEIPSLTSTNDEYVGRCKTEQINSNPISTQHDNPGTSQEFIVKTTVGTMAGVSSVLALLYRYTPAGRWINTGLRGSGGRINNNLYINGPDELIFDGLEHNNFNSYNIGYEAA
ncbi:Plasmodium vivax Vir protein, putative, partial [Plasmodium vivax]